MADDNAQFEDVCATRNRVCAIGHAGGKLERAQTNYGFVLVAACAAAMLVTAASCGSGSGKTSGTSASTAKSRATPAHQTAAANRIGSSITIPTGGTKLAVKVLRVIDPLRPRSRPCPMPATACSPSHCRCAMSDEDLRRDASRLGQHPQHRRRGRSERPVHHRTLREAGTHSQARTRSYRNGLPGVRPPALAERGDVRLQRRQRASARRLAPVEGAAAAGALTPPATRHAHVRYRPSN
jgi:hypothetical protein